MFLLTKITVSGFLLKGWTTYTNLSNYF